MPHQRGGSVDRLSAHARADHALPRACRALVCGSIRASREGSEVVGLYDPLVAKLCVHGVDRDHARRRMLRALGEYEIDGITTLVGFHRALLEHPCFAAGRDVPRRHRVGGAGRTRGAVVSSGNKRSGGVGRTASGAGRPGRGRGPPLRGQAPRAGAAARGARAETPRPRRTGRTPRRCPRRDRHADAGHRPRGRGRRRRRGRGGPGRLRRRGDEDGERDHDSARGHRVGASPSSPGSRSRPARSSASSPRTPIDGPAAVLRGPLARERRAARRDRQPNRPLAPDRVPRPLDERRPARKRPVRPGQAASARPGGARVPHGRLLFIRRPDRRAHARATRVRRRVEAGPDRDHANRVRGLRRPARTRPARRASPPATRSSSSARTASTTRAAPGTGARCTRRCATSSTRTGPGRSRTSAATVSRATSSACPRASTTAASTGRPPARSSTSTSHAGSLLEHYRGPLDLHVPGAGGRALRPRADRARRASTTSRSSGSSGTTAPGTSTFAAVGGEQHGCASRTSRATSPCSPAHRRRLERPRRYVVSPG